MPGNEHFCDRFGPAQHEPENLWIKTMSTCLWWTLVPSQKLLWLCLCQHWDYFNRDITKYFPNFQLVDFLPYWQKYCDWFGCVPIVAIIQKNGEKLIWFHSCLYFSFLKFVLDWQERWVFGLDCRCVASAAIVQTEGRWSNLRIDDHHSLRWTQANVDDDISKVRTVTRISGVCSKKCHLKWI